MTEKKLTDEEILKVLDTCFMAGGNGDCGKCVLFTGNGLGECMRTVAVETLDLIHRLQEENKDLKEERENMQAVIFGLEEEKMRLQKQVDELKERYLEESKERCKFEQLYEKKCHKHNIGAGVQRSHWEKKVKQTVKDTAKEICDLILEHWEKKQFVECDWLRVAISEKYGVEVE